MVSLGCPKALVDSERILTRLRAEGYAISPDYAGADAVIVNTCGFLDSAKAESLEAIGEALAENGRVIVTGCLGAEPDYITGAHPKVLAVTGPQQYEQVLDAVHAAVPPAPDPFIDLLPARACEADAAALQLSQDFRGLQSQVQVLHHPRHARAAGLAPGMAAVLREAERLVEAGCGAAGDQPGHLRLWRRPTGRAGGTARSPIWRAIWASLGAWVRLHYVYPYPHVRELIPLMAEGRGAALSRHPVPARPSRHAQTHGAARRRGAHAGRDRRLARDLPRHHPALDLHRRLSGRDRGRVPDPARLAGRGAARPGGLFQYENVAGARSNALPDHVPEEVKEERWHRFMEKAQAISEAKLAAKVGSGCR
jgi:ribosomal protein S12 methylthiotransferase